MLIGSVLVHIITHNKFVLISCEKNSVANHPALRAYKKRSDPAPQKWSHQGPFGVVMASLYPSICLWQLYNYESPCITGNVILRCVYVV